jgi:predicted phage tail protein
MQRITSMVTGIHFSVRQNDWNQAQKLSNDLQKEFAKMKANIQDNQSEAVKMLEISLDDLRSAVQKQDAMLVLIRTNLVTSNIEELDAKLSQQQSE